MSCTDYETIEKLIFKALNYKKTKNTFIAINIKGDEFDFQQNFDPKLLTKKVFTNIYKELVI